MSKDFLDQLADKLTIYEASSLIARIHEKKCKSKAKRFGLFPITDWAAFHRTLKLESSFWLSHEIDFSNDINHFLAFTEEEKQPLLMAFGFFDVGDGSIVNMLAYQMILISDTLEKQNFYVVQLDNERVHAMTYATMIYTLVEDPNEREKIFNAVENIKSIKNMNKFIEESFTYPDGERQIYVSLAASEYIMFTPLFCIIFWYRAYKRGKIPMVILSNELIAQDEAAHCYNGCENYKLLSTKYTDEEIWKLIDKVVLLVSDFADEVLTNVHLVDLTPDNVKKYIKFVADDLLLRLGHNKFYNVENPFIWMDFTNLINKTNLYEGRNIQYRRFNVDQTIDKLKKLMDGKNVKENVNLYEKIEDEKF